MASPTKQYRHVPSACCTLRAMSSGGIENMSLFAEQPEARIAHLGVVERAASAFYLLKGSLEFQSGTVRAVRAHRLDHVRDGQLTPR